MSRLWPSTSSSEFERTLTSTTSDLLPSATPPDLASTLHLADLIRSSALPPLVAVNAILKRLAHENPNVQLLTLAVLDICIKNGGTPFLIAVAARDPATELDRLARGRASTSNRQVQEQVLKLVQGGLTVLPLAAQPPLLVLPVNRSRRMLICDMLI